MFTRSSYATDAIHKTLQRAGAPAMHVRAPVTPTVADDVFAGSPATDQELVANVRELSISIGLPGATNLGLLTRTIAGGDVAGGEITEGTPMPVLKPAWIDGGLTPRRFGALTVCSKEALKTTPGIGELIATNLTTAVAIATDSAFLADVLTALGGAVGSGSTDIEADVDTLLEAFDGDLRTAVLALNPRDAVAASFTQAGRDIGARGGELAGLAARTSRAVPLGTIALVDPTGVALGWDDVGHVEQSSHATLELDSAPTGSGTKTSLFQSNASAFKAIIRAAWDFPDTGRIAAVTGASWSAGAS